MVSALIVLVVSLGSLWHIRKLSTRIILVITRWVKPGVGETSNNAYRPIDMDPRTDNLESFELQYY